MNPHFPEQSTQCDSPKPGYNWRGILFLRLCCLSKLTFAQGRNCCLQNASCLSNCLFANFWSCIFWWNCRNAFLLKTIPWRLYLCRCHSREQWTTSTESAMFFSLVVFPTSIPFERFKFPIWFWFQLHLCQLFPTLWNLPHLSFPNHNLHLWGLKWSKFFQDFHCSFSPRCNNRVVLCRHPLEFSRTQEASCQLKGTCLVVVHRFLKRPKQSKILEA